MESHLHSSLRNSVKAILVREHYERSLPSSMGSLAILGFIAIMYQFEHKVLAGPMVFVGIGIAIATIFRAVISFLGLKNRISQLANEKYIKLAVFVNSALWGLGFCMDAWYARIEGVEGLIALSLIFGFTSVAPVALITIPVIQVFFFFVCLFAPACIYLFRVFDGSLPPQTLAVPGFLLIMFFYQVGISRKMGRMLVRDIENNLVLKQERQNLKDTLEKLKETQGELTTERAKTLNSERLAFLGNMASGVAHEINNPLTISGGQLFKIQNYLAKNPGIDPSGFIDSCIQKVSDMNTRIRDVVRGLQYFARERRVDSLEGFSLGELMEFTFLFFKEKMKSSGIQFELEVPPAVFLVGQKNDLSQSLFNIVENAIEALHGLPDPMITVGFKMDGQRVEIRITDNGPGVSQSMQEHIFDPFFTTKDVGQGTGLGLSVARGIIKAHGGDIHCISFPGMTTFSISLPFVNK